MTETLEEMIKEVNELEKRLTPEQREVYQSYAISTTVSHFKNGLYDDLGYYFQMRQYLREVLK